jgi:hypothetical protein
VIKLRLEHTDLQAPTQFLHCSPSLLSSDTIEPIASRDFDETESKRGREYDYDQIDYRNEVH